MTNQMEGIMSGVRGFEGSKTLSFASEHQRFWMLLLIGVSFVSSLQSACATPLVGLSVAGALVFSRSRAFLTTGAIWAVNQTAGFAFLHYPKTENTALWGLVLGIAMIGSTYVSQRLIQFWSRFGEGLKSMGSFGAGFLMYEIILYVASLQLGGSGSFSAGILSKVLITNAVVFFLLNLFQVNPKRISRNLRAISPSPFPE